MHAACLSFRVMPPAGHTGSANTNSQCRLSCDPERDSSAETHAKGFDRMSKIRFLGPDVHSAKIADVVAGPVEALKAAVFQPV
jgi:hypothetical protein